MMVVTTKEIINRETLKLSQDCFLILGGSEHFCLCGLLLS